MGRSITLFAAKGWILFIMLSSVLSCGREVGGGGSEGANETGIILTIQSAAPVSTNDVDVEQGTFANGGCGTTATAGQAESFTDHNATVTIATALVPGATQPPVSKTVIVSHYTIQYDIGSGYTGPAIETRSVKDQTTIVVAGSTSKDFALFSLAQKDTFLTAVGGAMGRAQIPYNVIYTVYGEDEYGRSVSAKGATNIYLGNYFHTCS